MLTIDVLYFDNCPHYKEAEKALREVLDEEHVDAEVQMMSVSESGQAAPWHFIGSPTIIINGEDLEANVNRETPYQGHCRMYMYKNELYEYPPKEMVRKGLKRFM